MYYCIAIVDLILILSSAIMLVSLPLHQTTNQSPLFTLRTHTSTGIYYEWLLPCHTQLSYSTLRSPRERNAASSCPSLNRSMLPTLQYSVLYYCNERTDTLTRRQNQQPRNHTVSHPHHCHCVSLCSALTLSYCER
jgi:hypothetical protein